VVWEAACPAPLLKELPVQAPRAVLLLPLVALPVQALRADRGLLLPLVVLPVQALRAVLLQVELLLVLLLLVLRADRRLLQVAPLLEAPQVEVLVLPQPG